MEFTYSFAKLFYLSIYLVAPILIFLSTLIIIIGQLVGHLEKWTVFDTFYWSLITATTVGYGDIRPLKKLSKVCSIMIAFLGLMLTGIVIAITLSTVSIILEKNLDEEIISKMKRI